MRWILALGILAALGVGIYLYLRLDDEVRRGVEQAFDDHYSDLDVRVQSAKVYEGRGIEVRGLRIFDPRLSGPRSELVSIESMFLTCDAKVSKLLSRQLDIRQVVFRRVYVRAVRETSGQWNLARLVPFPKFGDNPPKLIFKSGVVEVFDPSSGTPKAAVIREIDGEYTPIARQGGGRPQQAHVRAKFTSDFMQQGMLEGTLDVEAGSFVASGALNNVQVMPELFASLPIDTGSANDFLVGLRCTADVDFAIDCDPARAVAINYRLNTRLRMGRFAHPKFPYPLNDIDATLDIDNNRVVLKQLVARYGHASVTASGEASGLRETPVWSLKAQARRIALDDQLRDALPAEYACRWDEFLPAGEIDVDAELAYDGDRLIPNVLVHCSGVSFEYHQFPYRLSRGVGTISLRDNRLAVDLTVHGSHRPLRIRAQVRDPGPKAIGWFEIHGRELSVDQRLLAAMPEKTADVVRRLNPGGTFNFFWRAWKEHPDEPKPHSRTLLEIADGTIRYEKFPYPLVQVRGSVEVTDGTWEFRDLEGRNHSGVVRCSGRLGPRTEPDASSSGEKELVLEFQGTDIHLEEQLRDALPEHARRFWEQLQPRGRCNFSATVRSSPTDGPLDLSVVVEPVTETASIEPVGFPYRLEKLQGTASFDGGSFRLENFRAVHGRTRIAARGGGDARPDGSWYVHFDSLTIDQIRADREFVAALPAGLRKAMTHLNVIGPVNVRGSLGFARPAETDAPLESRWDLLFTLHRNELNCGLPLTDIYGDIRLTGHSVGKQFQSTGELSLDSASWRAYQLTQILGPFFVDNQKVLFGKWAQPQTAGGPQQAQPRRISSKFYQGTMLTDAWVRLGTFPQWRIETSLTGASLGRFARETMRGGHELSGVVNAALALQGDTRGTHTLKGNGQLTLREADLYELPAMVSLLKVLTARVPDATAFTASDVQYRIDGEHVYFDRLDLLGDAVSLYGKGEMDFDQEVGLTFYSIVGRSQFSIPVLREFVGEASQQMLQVNVSGNLRDPVVVSEVFPGVTKALEQLQTDLQQGGKPASGVPRNGLAEPPPGTFTPRRSSMR